LRVLADTPSDADATHPGLALKTIAAEVHLSPSTTHRIIRTLVDTHLVIQDPVTERYQLGPLSGVLGRKYLSSIGLESVQPILQRLCTSTGESTSFAVLHNGTAHVVAQKHSSQALRVDHLSGSELSLHASAMGKVLLAFNAKGISETIQQLEKLEKLEKFTENTITSVKELTAHIEEVQSHKFAMNIGERYDGANGIAVPVLAVEQSAQYSNYALGIQGPSTRLTPQRMHELVEACTKAAAEIAALGLSVA
jgi:IclR family acetate operon transcriptional repressor